MSDGISSFTVGADTYKYVELAPLEAMRFGIKVAKALGPAVAKIGEAASGKDVASVTASIGPALATVDEETLDELLKTAISRVYTPVNECLGNQAVFNSWFKDRKDSLFTVSFMALFHLSKDFFPKALDTILKNSPK